jgi:hypothetical protein
MFNRIIVKNRPNTTRSIRGGSDPAFAIQPFRLIQDIEIRQIPKNRSGSKNIQENVVSNSKSKFRSQTLLTFFGSKKNLKYSPPTFKNTMATQTQTENSDKYFAPKEQPVFNLDCKKAFESLSSQEKKYTHFLTEGR